MFEGGGLVWAQLLLLLLLAEGERRWFELCRKLLLWPLLICLSSDRRQQGLDREALVLRLATSGTIREIDEARSTLWVVLRTPLLRLVICICTDEGQFVHV